MTQPSPPAAKLDHPNILSLLLQPQTIARPPLPDGSLDLEIPLSATGPCLGCRLHLNNLDAPMLLFFHGNGETVADYDDYAEACMTAGFNILIGTYRGYGWSSGVPTIAKLFSDTVKLFDFLKDYCRTQGLTGALFVMGRSLGSACAIDLAYRFPEEISGLIIESGFADTLPLLERLGCDLASIAIKEEECFNNIDKIREITIPTLIIHGGGDRLIPIHEAEKLQAESGAKTKQFQVVPGGDHNSLIAVAGHYYFDTITTFADTVTGKNTWRQRRKKFREQKK